MTFDKYDIECLIYILWRKSKYDLSKVPTRTNLLENTYKLCKIVKQIAFSIRSEAKIWSKY